MHWYYSKEFTDSKTPSRADGVEFETELRYRKEGARFIMELGNKLGLYPFEIAFPHFSTCESTTWAHLDKNKAESVFVVDKQTTILSQIRKKWMHQRLSFI